MFAIECYFELMPIDVKAKINILHIYYILEQQNLFCCSL